MVVDYPLIGALLAPSYRSRAILQMLRHAGVCIGGAIILPGDEPVWQGQSIYNFPLYRNTADIFSFCSDEPVRDTLDSMGVPCISSPTADINSAEFVEFIRGTAQSIYLYSGSAGCILRPPLLRESGKRFIHAHGGDAPRYSGSTAFYYSLLERGDIGATTFWMDEGLDTGDVIGRIVAPPHQDIEIDRIQDPVIRAEAFVWAINQPEYARPEVQDHANRVTYHVIHPVLKHYALVKAGLGRRS